MFALQRREGNAADVAVCPEDGRLVEVRVHDIRLAARIGAHAHELDRRQTLRVTAVLRLIAPPSDRIEDTVDYSFIVDKAEALADEHIALIETFGTRLAEACFAIERVEQAEILVEKPGALANGIASARIVLTRERGASPWPAVS